MESGSLVSGSPLRVGRTSGRFRAIQARAPADESLHGWIFLSEILKGSFVLGNLHDFYPQRETQPFRQGNQEEAADKRIQFSRQNT